MIDTVEKRRQALDFGKIRGTGMPVPTGHLSVSARAHVLNLYYETAAPSILYYWRNRIKPSTIWANKSNPTSIWKGRNVPGTQWSPKVGPSDGSTQIED